MQGGLVEYTCTLPQYSADLGTHNKSLLQTSHITHNVRGYPSRPSPPFDDLVMNYSTIASMRHTYPYSI